MAGNNMVEWTIEIDQDVYDNASQVCKMWGTTIEDLTTALIYFCVEPDNLPLLKSFLEESNNQEAKSTVAECFFSKVLIIARHLGMLNKYDEKEIRELVRPKADMLIEDPS